MNILITGGTGSLGRALVNRLIAWPTFGKVGIYSRDEHKQEDMRRQFNNNDQLRFLIGDIRDKDRLTLAVKDYNLIVHAAAMKIVPIAEYNPFEVVKTNVLGAQNLVDAVLANHTWCKVIAVSTDKAVSPINLYGASKLCAEKIMLAANNIRGLSGPRFTVCRYGNVANSNGSVIPVFNQMLANGNQLPVTHPDMTRFWITLEQAVDLILYTFDNMYGGEIVVPVMPSFRVHDLAMGMMKAAYPPEKQWAYVSGIRPGEKIHEDIITAQEMEKTDLTPDEKYFIIGRGDREVKPIQPHSEKLASNSDGVKMLNETELMEKVKEL